eukprot:SAG11_NODE_7826_length_1091_cov_4.443548_2_plen_102_part_00
MNILDLNHDIISNVEHNIFLRKIMEHREDYYNRFEIGSYVNDPGNDNDTYETQRVNNKWPDCIQTNNNVGHYWYDGRQWWAYRKCYGYDLYDVTDWRINAI